MEKTRIKSSSEMKEPDPFRKILSRFWAKTPVFVRNLRARIDPATVFVMGNYKTGSTAISTLLAMSTDTTTINDFFWRTPGDVKRQLLRKEKTLEWYIKRYRYLFPYKIIKEPDLIFYFDQLETLFPRGRFVFLLRDPRDTIRSTMNFLDLPGNADDLSIEQIKELPGCVWKLVIDGALYGTRGDNYIATQALRWNRIVEIYEQYVDKMIIFKYETFCQDKIRAIQLLAEKVGLQVKNDITPHINVQFRPQGDTFISWLEFFGRKNLSIIESICNEKMQSYGYLSSLKFAT